MDQIPPLSYQSHGVAAHHALCVFIKASHTAPFLSPLPPQVTLQAISLSLDTRTL